MAAAPGDESQDAAGASGASEGTAGTGARRTAAEAQATTTAVLTAALTAGGMNPEKAQRLAGELTRQWMRENRDRLAAAGISVPPDL